VADSPAACDRGLRRIGLAALYKRFGRAGDRGIRVAGFAHAMLLPGMIQRARGCEMRHARAPSFSR